MFLRRSRCNTNERHPAILQIVVLRKGAAISHALHNVREALPRRSLVTKLNLVEEAFQQLLLLEMGRSVNSALA